MAGSSAVDGTTPDEIRPASWYAEDARRQGVCGNVRRRLMQQLRWNVAAQLRTPRSSRARRTRAGNPSSEKSRLRPERQLERRWEAKLGKGACTGLEGNGQPESETGGVLPAGSGSAFNCARTGRTVVGRREVQHDIVGQARGGRASSRGREGPRRDPASEAARGVRRKPWLRT